MDAAFAAREEAHNAAGRIASSEKTAARLKTQGMVGTTHCAELGQADAGEGSACISHEAVTPRGRQAPRSRRKDVLPLRRTLETVVTRRPRSRSGSSPAPSRRS